VLLQFAEQTVQAVGGIASDGVGDVRVSLEQQGTAVSMP
jgi:hypothetical protein